MTLDFKSIARENLRLRWARGEASRRADALQAEIDATRGRSVKMQRVNRDEVLQAVLRGPHPEPSAVDLAKERDRMIRLGRYAAVISLAIKRITQAERRPLDGDSAYSIDKVFQVSLDEYRKAADPDTFLCQLTARTTRLAP